MKLKYRGNKKANAPQWLHHVYVSQLTDKHIDCLILHTWWLSQSLHCYSQRWRLNSSKIMANMPQHVVTMLMSGRLESHMNVWRVCILPVLYTSMHGLRRFQVFWLWH